MDQKKYQWSKFVGPNREEQFVVRCDSETEFEEAIKYIRTMANRAEIESVPINNELIEPIKCEKCGEPAVKKSGVKNGRAWGGIFCQSNKDHVTWIKV